MFPLTLPARIVNQLCGSLDVGFKDFCFSVGCNASVNSVVNIMVIKAWCQGLHEDLNVNIYCKKHGRLLKVIGALVRQINENKTHL